MTRHGQDQTKGHLGQRALATADQGRSGGRDYRGGRVQVAGQVARAVTWGDRAYARLPAFRRRVDRALAVIAEAAQIGTIGVSFSAGKDSTVLLDLVRQVQPAARVAFFDSGCEYPWTYDLVAHYEVETVKPQMSLPEMCRHGGYWGYENPADPEAEFDFMGFLVVEPAVRFSVLNDLAVSAIGLRAEESAGRRISLLKRGELYWVAERQLWHLCPLAYWKHADIWAYIAHRGLRYNEVYDRMAAFGIPRQHWRVSTLLGLSGTSANARLGFLRAVAPDVFWQLAAEFPYIRGFS